MINPTSAQREISELDLTVASTKEKVVMIEAGAKEVPEEKVLEAIFYGHEMNSQIVDFINQIVAECGKPKHAYEEHVVPEKVIDVYKRQGSGTYCPCGGENYTRRELDGY